MPAGLPAAKDSRELNDDRELRNDWPRDRRGFLDDPGGLGLASRAASRAAQALLGRTMQKYSTCTAVRATSHYSKLYICALACA